MKHLFSLLAALWIVAAGTLKAANEIYAVYSTDGKTMTLYYDDQRTARKGLKDWFYDYYMSQSEKDRIWAVKTVVLDISMKEAKPTSTSRWFYNYRMTKIVHLDYLNTENVTDMSYMFASCTSLVKLNASTLNTKNVTNMEKMFGSCMELESIDLRNFDMQNVIDTY